MRVLWLSGNPSLFISQKNGYNNGGWIGALQSELTKNSEIELAVAFIYDDEALSKVEMNGTIYYPIRLYSSIITKVKHNMFYEKHDTVEIECLRKIVLEFKPDVIHVWGTEISFGLITMQTSIPVVIHIQGILNAVYNAFLPPGVSKKMFLNSGTSILKRIKNKQTIRFWEHNTRREIEIIKRCKNFIGRTQWDRSITKFIAPDSRYFYCSELLRAPFYKSPKWKAHNRGNKIHIISVLSDTTYKGIDLVLKCSDILRKYSMFDFEWSIVGVDSCSFAETMTGINAKDSNVNLSGILAADELINKLLDSDIYVHTSYIDNSPNSVCEAQILGLPIISTNVGGVSSLIEDNVTGFLLPTNDPWLLSSKIIDIMRKRDLCDTISKNAIEIATKRHSHLEIVNSLISTYSTIIDECGNL